MIDNVRLIVISLILAQWIILSSSSLEMAETDTNAAPQPD